MMSKKITLSIDAFINLILGILLLAYSLPLVEFLGVPYTQNYFYPNILGAIFIGIAIALIVEAYRKKSEGFIGLGLFGAISINLCGGIVLFLWLVLGDLGLPLKGYIFLWTLDIILLVISIVELLINLRKSYE